MADPADVKEYSARLLLPKLLLAAIVGLLEAAPWSDPDMDLNSQMHVMRPDAGKEHEMSGYGGGPLLLHTDGYWNSVASVPRLFSCLGVCNPFDEPTSFLPIEAIYQVPAPKHEEYAAWHREIADLVPRGWLAGDFVRGLVRAALEPNYSFVMGAVGGGAERAARRVPLLDRSSGEEDYVLRYKSTCEAHTPEAEVALEFFKRQVARHLASGSRAAFDVVVGPGDLMLAFNGAGLHVDPNAEWLTGHFAQPVTGPGTIHGRGQLRQEGGCIERTLARGNLLSPLGRPRSGACDGTAASHQGDLPRSVRALLEQGYRAGNLQR